MKIPEKEMNYGSEMWDWQGQDYTLDSTSIAMSKPLLNEMDQNVDHISYMLSYETTPIKACGDLAYRINNESTGKELEEYREPLTQAKRRRMLQFESELLEAPICHDEEFLRSKETPESLEDAINEMSQWVAGFTEGMSESTNECMDPSSEGWIADCFNDAEMHFCTEDLNNTSAQPDVQIDITELCNVPHEYDDNPVKKHPANTHHNVFFKGKKSYMHATPKLTSSVAYPFAFIKPCGVHGDVTLKDINRRIHNPPKSKLDEDDPLVSYPTSAFSGKPVVGKTKIHTEGKGTITIMRTKG